MSPPTQLDRKYRPGRFSDLVGQPVAVRYLSALAATGNAYAILASGPSGCGKLTAARLYARLLHCTGVRQGGEPCNGCRSCLAHLAGEHEDYQEIDASKEQALTAALDRLEAADDSKRSILVLRGVQSLPASFLPWVEGLVDPGRPNLSVFLTTTRAEALAPSLLGACYPARFNRLSPRDSLVLLAKVCRAEGLDYEPLALDLVAHAGGGHPREMLRRLEHVAQLGRVGVAEASMLFGQEANDRLPRLWLALLRGKTQEAAELLDAWADEPQPILNLWRQFVLWLQYRTTCNVEIAVNPQFATIDPDRVRDVKDALSDRARELGTDLDGLFATLNRVLGSDRVDDPIVLHGRLRDLHLALQRQAAPVQAGAAAGAAGGRASSAPPPSGKGRKFAEAYLVRNGVAVLPDEPATPAYVPPVQPAAPAPSTPAPLPVFMPPPSLPVPSVASGFAPPPSAPFVPPPAQDGQSATVEVTVEKVPPGSVGGEFAFSLPTLPKKERVYAHDLTLQGWTEGGEIKSVFRVEQSG